MGEQVGHQMAPDQTNNASDDKSMTSQRMEEQQCGEESRQEEKKKKTDNKRSLADLQEVAPKRLKMLDQAEENSEKESENNEPQFVEEEKSEMCRHLDDSDLEYNETMMDAANEEQLQEQKNKEKKQDSN